MPFGFKIVIGAAQDAGEWVVGVAVLRLPDDRVLSAGEVGDDPPQPVAFGVAFPRFSITHSGQVGGEDRAPVGSENAFCEESGTASITTSSRHLGCPDYEDGTTGYLV
ncbi:hypothetical protein ABZ816_34740 [Actinosynnema sp. NPDC047251]|uniref:hypothetical protein n=1 Tax=Saccharothrix espanaensis TaxID=103731 RepID=UPI0002F928C2|nr:hypothetical protein [Saccharothrix espanaensis]